MDFFFSNLTRHKLFKGRTGNKDKWGGPGGGAWTAFERKRACEGWAGGGTAGVGVSWEESRLTGDPVIGMASVEG